MRLLFECVCLVVVVRKVVMMSVTMSSTTCSFGILDGGPSKSHRLGLIHHFMFTTAVNQWPDRRVVSRESSS